MKTALYEPLDRPQAIDEGIWLVDGPTVGMALGAGVKIPFPTRMVLVRLARGELVAWSPTELSDALRARVDALGEVRHLVSPNKLHYAHIGAWKRAYPEATAWASPGVRARARSQRIEAPFDADLGDGPEAPWSGELDQVIFRGSRFLDEVVFFHRPSRTLLLADLIQNFEPHKLGWAGRTIARIGGALDPDGGTPADLRATFIGRKAEARACFERILAWAPERIVMTHGRWYERDGMRELERAFRWLR